MRGSEQEQTGGAGVSEVSAKFQRIGWGPVPNDVHDLGTDLLVQARDRRRFDRGSIVGAQVKAGASWFADEHRNDAGEVLGWWYYEPGAAHFDDWVTHGLPHLLVLHDLDSHTSFWVHVTAEVVLGTGKGCKILVPRGQTIDEDHVDELLAVAAQQKGAPRLEGTSFSASAGQVPPGRRLRYALLAPRLVAPHRNAGYDAAITPEEAVALCAQGRFLDLQRFSERQPSVPDPRQPYGGRDWRWSFVRSIWTWATEDDLDTLARAASDAPSVETKAAASVLLACALLRIDRGRDAMALLTDLISEDDLVPVDHSWVLVQRARLRADTGDVEGAREDAVSAQRQLPGDEDDPTVSAIGAAAAWSLFATAGFAAGDLARTLTAADTAVAWWRSQTIAWALDEAADRAFWSWAQDTTNRWSAEDLEAVNLFAAELNADLTGEHGAWRGISSLAARQTLLRGGDSASVSSALDALRRSGDHASVKLGIAHVRRTGPVDALADVIRSVRPESWTHTTGQSNLKVLAAAGDFADSQLADELIDMLVGVLGDSSAFVERVRPSFMVNLATIEAINGLLPAASSDLRHRVARYLAAQTGPIDAVLASGLTGWIRQFDCADVMEFRDGFWQLSTSDTGGVGAAILGRLAECDDAEAKAEVHRRALAGDLNALSAVGAVTALTSDQAETLLDKFEGMVRDTVDRAKRSEWGFGGFDGGRGLALFNIWFPGIARWDPLVQLLEDPSVGADDKRATLELILDAHDRVPDDVLARLGAQWEAIAASPVFEEVGGRSVASFATGIAIVGRAMAPDAADVALTLLALGSEEDRRGAAALLGRGFCERMRPLLASFLADGRVSVRRAGAGAVGRLAASAPDHVVVELARRLAADAGAIIPPALLVGLSRGEQSTELGREVAMNLRDHASAVVRRLSQEFLTRY